VVVVSAHDVRDEFAVGVSPTMTMVHDHPAATGLSWVARGAIDVAARLVQDMESTGVRARAAAPLLDHGAWVPLRALDPSGQLPVVTLSLHAGLIPELHLALGAALRGIRKDGVAILASGGLTHNQAEFRRAYSAGEDVNEGAPPSVRFSEWALSTFATSGRARSDALLQATDHPDFSWCHPSLDHWLPSLVAAGAAEDERGVVLHRGFQHSLSTAMLGFGVD
jgi:4,5-DOPA dioxygenase extradiol